MIKKRMLSVLTALAISVSTVSAMSFTASASIVNGKLFNTGFDDVSVWTSTVDGRYVTQKTEDVLRGNVYDIIQAGGGEAKNYYEFPEAISSGKIHISYEMNMNSGLKNAWLKLGTQASTQNVDVDTKRFVGMSYSAADSAFKIGVSTAPTASGADNANMADVAAFEGDVWNTVDIVVDADTKKTDIYLNGTKVIESVAGNVGDGAIYGFALYSKPETNGTSGGYIDNLSVNLLNAAEVSTSVDYITNYADITFSNSVVINETNSVKIREAVTGAELSNVAIVATKASKTYRLRAAGVTQGKEYIIEFAQPLYDIFGNKVNANDLTFYVPYDEKVYCINEDFTNYTPTSSYATVETIDGNQVLAMKKDPNGASNTGLTIKLLDKAHFIPKGKEIVHEFRYKTVVETGETPILTVRNLCDDAAGTSASVFEAQKGTIMHYSSVSSTAADGGSIGTLTSSNWHNVKVTYNSATGKQKVEIFSDSGASELSVDNLSANNANNMKGKQVAGILLRHRGTSTNSIIYVDNVKVYYEDKLPAVENVRFGFNGKEILPNAQMTPDIDSVSIKFTGEIDEETLATGIKLYKGEDTVETTGGVYDSTTNTYTFNIKAQILDINSAYKLEVKDASGVAVKEYVYPFTTGTGSLEIMSFELVNDKGAEATNEDFASGNALAAKASVKNTTGNVEDVVLIYALYDSDGNFIDMDFDVYNEATPKKDLKCDIMNYSGASEVKVFLWDSLSGMNAYKSYIVRNK